jgi:Coenzyme PQQ synthesis protein D (PqqD)
VDFTLLIRLSADSGYMMAEDYPRRRADVNVRVVDGEAVVLDRQKELIHQLNQTATYIWEQCDGRFVVQEIAARLAETFDVAPETAMQDVVKVIQDLQALSLLEPSPDKPAF